MREHDGGGVMLLGDDLTTHVAAEVLGVTSVPAALVEVLALRRDADRAAGLGAG